MIPDLVLALADKFAARDAVRRIKDKFIQEGFAKGVAAGVMGWTEQEVAANLMNRVTDFRIKDLEDPGGLLTKVTILKLAEAQENYAVWVGFQFSSPKNLKWKKEMGAIGFKVLVDYGYHSGEDPEILFEYDFIDKLAWVLRPTTNSILEHGTTASK